MTISKKILMLASCAAMALAACSPGHDNGRVAGQLTPPPPGTAQPVALPITGPRGLEDSVYFSDELSQARAKVEAMRTEMAALSAKLAGLQDKIKTLVADMPPPPPGLAILPADANVVTTTKTEIVPATATLAEVAQVMDAKPVSTPMGDGPIAVSPVEMTTPGVAETTTVTTTTAATTAAPTQITGEMGTPAAEVKKPEAKGMKPIVKAETKTQVKTETKTEVKTDVKAATGADGVNAVRFGTHGETVRVVLDVTGSAEGAKPELDNAEHIMTITLPKTKWAGTATQSVAKNPLVASYSAQAAGDGSVVAFVLKGDTKIVSTSVMKNPTRVVVDLAK